MEREQATDIKCFRRMVQVYNDRAIDSLLGNINQPIGSSCGFCRLALLLASEQIPGSSTENVIFKKQINFLLKELQLKMTVTLITC